MNPNMSPIDWAKRPIENYAQFSGRASRPEFWWFVLATTVAGIVARIVDSILGIQLAGPIGPLYILLCLAIIVPSIAVAIRRLHDTGRPGWWILLPAVPYILAIVLGGAAMMGGAASGSAMGMGAGFGIAMIFMLIALACAIVLIVFYCQPGTSGDNQYGPNPSGDGAGTSAG
jgi:uncharacterized membrane protein YhaH (DUF805 family)